MAAETWRIAGTVLIACSCDWGCPCNFNAKPTKGFCEGGWMWMTERGNVGDVSIDGLAFSILAAWPHAIHEGGGTAVAFMDERADDAQREAIAALVRGGSGGPWGIFINTYTLDGPHPARHEFAFADHRTTLKIGDSVSVEMMPITNPVTGAEAHPEMVLPEGLVVKRASLAMTKTFRVNDGVNYDHSGQYSAFAKFAYEGA